MYIQQGGQRAFYWTGVWGQAMRVLVIDDDPFMLDMMEMTLTAAGAAAVDLAENGPDGLDMLKANVSDISLVIIDWNMPEMNGLDVIRNMAAIDHGAAIALMSGDDIPVDEVCDAAKAQGARFLGFFEKPIGRPVLAGLLGEAATQG